MSAKILLLLLLLCFLLVLTEERKSGGSRSSSSRSRRPSPARSRRPSPARSRRPSPARARRPSPARSRKPSRGRGRPWSKSSRPRAPVHTTRTQRTVVIQKQRRKKILKAMPIIGGFVAGIVVAKTMSELIRSMAHLNGAVVHRRHRVSGYKRRCVASSAFESSEERKLLSTLQTIKAMDYLALSLPLSYYKKLDLKSTREVLKIAGKYDTPYNPALSKPAQNVIFTRLIKLTPRSDWTTAMGSTLKPLRDVVFNHIHLKRLPKAAILGIFSFARKFKFACKGKQPQIVKIFLKMETFDSFNTTILPKMGNALCHISVPQLKTIPTTAIQTEDHVRDMCYPDWSEAKVKFVTSLAGKQSLFTDLAKLSCNEKRIFSNCWNGVETEDFSKIDFQLSDLECFKNTSLSPRLQTIMAKKIKAKAGQLKNMSVDDMQRAVRVIGISLTELNELSLNKVKEISDEILESQMGKDKVMDTVAAKKIFEATNTKKIDNLSSKLLAKVPLRDVRNMDEKRVGFEETSNKTVHDDSDEMIDMSSAFVVIDKLKKREKPVHHNAKYWNNVFGRIRRFCCGFTKSDIEQFPDDFLPDYVSECKKIAYKCPAFTESIARRYEAMMKKQGIEAIMEGELLNLGNFLPGLKLTTLLKITGNMDARTIAVNQLTSVCENDIYPVWRRQIIATIAMAMLRVSDGLQIDLMTLDKLGCLVKYLDIQVLKRMSPAVVANASQELGVYKLPLDVRKVFVAKLMLNHHKNVNTFTFAIQPEEFRKFLSDLNLDLFTNYFDLVFPLVTAADVDSINKDWLIALKFKIAEMNMTEKVARAIMDKISVTSNTNKPVGREKRALKVGDTSKKTATDIIEMDKLMYGFTVNEIMALSDSVVKEVLHVIGNLDGFSPEQRRALVAVLKRTYGSISLISDEDLKRIRYLILGMNVSDIGSLSLKDLEVISKFGNVRGYTKEQVAAIFKEIKKDLARASLQNFTGPELLAASSFVTAASASEMKKIQTESYVIASRELGEVQNWSQEQMSALKELAIKLYGPVGNWKEDIMHDVGAAIGGFTFSEMKNVKPSSIGVVKPVAISQIPPSVFKALSIESINSMSQAQYGAVTNAQIKQLYPSQKNAIMISSEMATTPDYSVLYKPEPLECTETCGAIQSIQHISITGLLVIISSLGLLQKYMF